MSSAIFVGPTYSLSQRVSDDTLELSLPPQRACDRCRRRKQKCDGLKDCLNCKRSALICTYHAAPKRRGPKRRRVIPWSRSALDTNSLQFQQFENESPASDGIESLAVSTPEAFAELPAYGIDDSSVFNPFTVDGSSHDSYDTPNSACYPESGVHSGSDVFDEGDSESFQFPSTADEPIRVRSSVTTCEDDNCSNRALTRFQLQPYLQYFFDYLYPIFPVLDITKFQDEFLDDPNLPLSTNEYALLTALSAAISAQLNLSGSEESITAVYHDSIAAPNRLMPSADFLIAQCLDTKRQAGYIDATDEYTVLTSFFLFYYYGNFNQSQSAWYHLREAIHFALMLQLNNSRTYDGMVSDKEQRLRRIYWLLYVTERAYALQTGGYTILQPSIEIPRVFQSGNPRLVYGFVILINVFRSMNQYNLTSRCEDSLEAAPVSKEIISNNAFDSQELDETQRIDIEVTRHWLRVLALRKRPSGGMVRDHLTPLHALNVSKDLLGIVTPARRQSLEVHGIGMEQKLFDVACVLSNVIQDTPSISADDFSAAHNMLHSFMRLLVSFRNRESQYLQPLLQQATKSLARGISVPQPLALDAPEYSTLDSED